MSNSSIRWYQHLQLSKRLPGYIDLNSDNLKLISAGWETSTDNQAVLKGAKSELQERSLHMNDGIMHANMAWSWLVSDLVDKESEEDLNSFSPPQERSNKEFSLYHPATKSLSNIILKIRENAYSLKDNPDYQRDFMFEVVRDEIQTLLSNNEYSLGFEELFKMAVMIGYVPEAIMERSLFAKAFEAIIATHAIKGYKGNNWRLFPIYFCEIEEIPEELLRDKFGVTHTYERLTELHKALAESKEAYWTLQANQDSGIRNRPDYHFRKWALQILDQLDLFLELGYKPMMRTVKEAAEARN